ncbi:MAG: aldo/keto reductase [Acidimicrobiia bacterium]|nr:aldo/keto reductase [Acidimicrobiia bacterium]
MADLPLRPLGSSGIDVSVLSLGSWRTFEPIGLERSIEVMGAARRAGINFLDDARYNDETGTAPVPTGYSEVLFGEIFRAVGWVRDEVVVANKLWWEFWPDQDAAAELDASLDRMGLDHVDLIYSMPPPEGLPVTDLITQVAGLVTTGRARAWGVGNWPADLIAVALTWCTTNHLPMPCAAQLPYSIARPGWVEGHDMAEVLSADGVSLVASSVLASGVLSGKYLRGETGRVSGSGDDPTVGTVANVARGAAELAEEWGISPAHVAFCFALAHPALASVLFGATSPEQVRENVAAVDVFAGLSAAEVARVRALAGGAST